MRILVVLVALAAFCHADDDDSEEVTFSHVAPMPAVTPVQTISHPLLKAHIPATFPQVRTVPSSVMKVQTPIAHAMSSSPAVMRIPKPGVRFNIPVPQTQRFALPVEKAVPETVAMPKTVEAIHAIPTPVATLKSAAVPVPVNVHEFMPWSAMQSTGVPLPTNTFVPATQFEHNIQAQAIPYYSSSINYGSMFPNTFEVPASIFKASFAFPQQAAVVPSAIPVAETMPIQYTTASNVAMPTVNMPFMASPFQMKAMEIPQAINYWRDFQTPQHMTNFMDLTTGGFSYVNVIGDVSSVPMSQDTPMRAQHPFKAIQSQISNVISAKDVRVTPTAVEAQTSPVIAA